MQCDGRGMPGWLEGRSAQLCSSRMARRACGLLRTQGVRAGNSRYKRRTYVARPGPRSFAGRHRHLIVVAEQERERVCELSVHRVKSRADALAEIFSIHDLETVPAIRTIMLYSIIQ